MTTRAGADSAILACILLLSQACIISSAAEDKLAFSADKGKVDIRKDAPLTGKVNFANINAAESHACIKAYDQGWRTFLQNPCHTSMAAVPPTKIPVGKNSGLFLPLVALIHPRLITKG